MTSAWLQLIAQGLLQNLQRLNRFKKGLMNMTLISAATNGHSYVKSVWLMTIGYAKAA